MASSELWLPQRAAIRREMKKAGITQAELARELELRPQHISRMLSGACEGRLDQWVRIAEYLGMVWQLVAVDPNAPLTAWVEHHLGITLEPWQASRLRKIVKDRA